MLTNEIQPWQRSKQNCSHLTEINVVLYWSMPVTEAIKRYRPAFSQSVRHREMLQGLEDEGKRSSRSWGQERHEDLRTRT